MKKERFREIAKSIGMPEMAWTPFYGVTSITLKDETMLIPDIATTRFRYERKHAWLDVRYGVSSYFGARILPQGSLRMGQCDVDFTFTNGAFRSNSFRNPRAGDILRVVGYRGTAQITENIPIIEALCFSTFCSLKLMRPLHNMIAEQCRMYYYDPNEDALAEKSSDGAELRRMFLRFTPTTRTDGRDFDMRLKASKISDIAWKGTKEKT